MTKSLTNPLHTASLLVAPSTVIIIALKSQVALSSANFIVPFILTALNAIAVILVNQFAMKIKDQIYMALLFKFAKTFVLLGLLIISILIGLVDQAGFACVAFISGFFISMVCEVLTIKNNLLNK